MSDASPPRSPYSGRGALSNPQPRFLRRGSAALDDGWYQQEVAASIATQVRPEPARSIITRNDSPDIPFEQSINPYRGCEHGCIYCLTGDTPILMADGTSRPLAQVRTGDSLYGTSREGGYRRYVKTRVLAHWSVIKPAYRLTLRDGTVLVAGADHRFLTQRGWKYLTGTPCGADRKPHLTTGNKLMGTGAFATPPEHNQDYRGGYLCGLIRGDGLLGSIHIREQVEFGMVSTHSDWTSVIRRCWSAPGSGCGARASRPSASNSALARRTAGRCRRSVRTHACRCSGFAS